MGGGKREGGGGERHIHVRWSYHKEHGEDGFLVLRLGSMALTIGWRLGGGAITLGWGLGGGAITLGWGLGDGAITLGWGLEREEGEKCIHLQLHQSRSGHVHESSDALPIVQKTFLMCLECYFAQTVLIAGVRSREIY